MFSISKKELGQFFGSLTGYVSILLFILLSGIFLFILAESSILNNGYANLDKFFELAPWLLLFIIPAIAMRSLPDEYRNGTFEILRTIPTTAWQIALGKYIALLVVSVLILLPTITYIFTIKTLSATGNIDGGGILGSYIGLFLLAAVYAAVSLCAGSFTQNAVVAFLLSAFFCLILFFGFTAISALPFFKGTADYYIEMLGIDFHYKSISRGVLDTRDLIYFLSIIFLSLSITVSNIKNK